MFKVVNWNNLHISAIWTHLFCAGVQSRGTNPPHPQFTGGPVSICHFKTHKEHQGEQKSSSKPPQKKDFSLYVQNMPYSLGSEELGALFSAFGEVTSATVITKKRRSMGYGFVTYSSLDDAVIATSSCFGLNLICTWSCLGLRLKGLWILFQDWSRPQLQG
uniref:RRM domain-containing protein n=1 Tax=Cyprinus carpio TaxID=7962 RepID=A0A8C2Q0E0_CYPCA